MVKKLSDIKTITEMISEAEGQKMLLVNADEVAKAICGSCVHKEKCDSNCFLVGYIEHCTVIEAAPIRFAYWKRVPYPKLSKSAEAQLKDLHYPYDPIHDMDARKFECSRCRLCSFMPDYDDTMDRYCKRCGARMIGKIIGRKKIKFEER